MASRLEICQEALQEIGASSIENFDERSPEAAACRRVFDSSLEYILRAFEWSFATKRANLQLVPGDLPADWMYVYAYPNDCLNMLELMPRRESDTAAPYRRFDGVGLYGRPLGDTVAYTIEVNANDVRVIYTNLEDAVARYTRRITNIENIDALASQALKWQVAARIATTLKGDMDKAQMATQAYAQTLAQAAAMTKKEQQEMPQRTSTLIGARYGGRYR